MRIGIDCRTILNPTAGEGAMVSQYTNALVRNLLDIDRENEYVLFFDYRTKREAAQSFGQANVAIRFLPFSGYGKFLPVAYSQLLVAAAFLKERLDVLHGPANVVPLVYPKPFVITLHDLAIYKHPEWFPSQMFATRLLVPQSLKRAKQIIAVSQAIRDDARELFNIPAKKIAVIPEAADTHLLPLNDRHHNIRKVYRLPARYFLYVGTIEPRKNLPTLFRAWHQLQTQRSAAANDAQLILAGGVGHGGEDILPLIKKMKLTRTIRHIGHVSHNHKILLMRSATGFVFPTADEGFGLPVLEAMQVGLPVITTNTSSIPEVGNQAVLMVEPGDINALAEAMYKILTRPDLAATLVAKGRVQAAKFSWERTAQATLAVYKKVGQ